MRTSAALRIVKTFLARRGRRIGYLAISTPKEMYVCYATNKAWESGFITHEKLVEITDHIALLLGGAQSLEVWLMRVHGIPCMLNNDEYLDKLQVTRHAWVDNMIAEFQSKGD